MIIDSNNSKNFDDKTLLPPSFVPGPYDVICKRGKSAKNHEGNQRYRTLIESALGQYSKADSKMKKSVIVSEIVEFVRSKSPNGGFVKQDEETGEWYEVGTYLAREKTSQAFRDSLHLQYKSSTKAKKRRRDAKKENNIQLGNSMCLLAASKQQQHHNMVLFRQPQPLHLIASSFSPLDTLLEKQHAAYGGGASPDLLVSSIVSRAAKLELIMRRENDLFLSQYAAANANNKNRQYLSALVGI